MNAVIMKSLSKFHEINCVSESINKSNNKQNLNESMKNEITFNHINKSRKRKTFECSVERPIKYFRLYDDRLDRQTSPDWRYHFKRKCKQKLYSTYDMIDKKDQRLASNAEILDDDRQFTNECGSVFVYPDTFSEHTTYSLKSEHLIINTEKRSIENSKNNNLKRPIIDGCIKQKHLSDYDRPINVIRVNQTNKFTVRCLLVFLTQILIGHLLFSHYNRVSALDACLEHCNCIYSKNKFIADCSALALDSLPSVNDELTTKVHEQVQVLNLTRNSFIKLQNEMFYAAKMINLQRIYLSKGSLQSIGNLTFYRLNNLIELDLSQNRLTVVPKDSFYPTSKLIILDLSSNQIQTISEYSFHPLKMLKILSLENNKISVIDPKAFLGLAELETLKLSDNQISYLASESLSPLNKLHTLTLANNRWLCDCKMRQLKEFLLHNRRINVLDQPMCDNQPQHIWTEISIDSFLCTPRMIHNNSDRVYQVGQGSNLALECSFQVESTMDSQPAVIRWLWQSRPIANNSEGVVSSQRFLITEYDYYLTTETTSTPYQPSTSPPFKNHSSKIKGHSSSIFKFPVSNQLDVDDEDGLPLIELHDLNQFHRAGETIHNNQLPAKTIDPDQRYQSTQRSISSSPTTHHPIFNHHSFSIPPYEKHIVKRRIRKSRMEISFILELNQGEYVCEASNQAGLVSLNFTIYVNSVIRRTDFLANNRASATTQDPISLDNIINKRSGVEIPPGSDDASFNELNAIDQTAGQTKHQPLLNTSNSVVVGLVLGILFGILLVLAVFSLLIVALCKKKLTDQVDLMSTFAGTTNSSGQNSSTGCSTENSFLSTLAQVNSLQSNNLQACSIGGHPAISASGSTNDWYSTFANNFASNNGNSTNNTLSNLLTNNRTSNQNNNNYTSPLSIAGVHHSDTMSQFNSTNSLSMLSSNNLYGHLLAGHDQMLAGHHLMPHQISHHLINTNSQTGSNTDHNCGTLNVMNLESTLEKSDLNSNALQIYEDDDLKKSKIV